MVYIRKSMFSVFHKPGYKMAGQGLEAKILSLAQAIQYGNANGNGLNKLRI